jgi:hypothetical protein
VARYELPSNNQALAGSRRFGGFKWLEYICVAIIAIGISLFSTFRTAPAVSVGRKLQSIGVGRISYLRIQESQLVIDDKMRSDPDAPLRSPKCRYMWFMARVLRQDSPVPTASSKQNASGMFVAHETSYESALLRLQFGRGKPRQENAKTGSSVKWHRDSKRTFHCGIS